MFMLFRIYYIFIIYLVIVQKKLSYKKMEKAFNLTVIYKYILDIHTCTKYNSILLFLDVVF